MRFIRSFFAGMRDVQDVRGPSAAIRVIPGALPNSF